MFFFLRTNTHHRPRTIIPVCFMHRRLRWHCQNSPLLSSIIPPDIIFIYHRRYCLVFWLHTVRVRAFCPYSLYLSANAEKREQKKNDCPKSERMADGQINQRQKKKQKTKRSGELLCDCRRNQVEFGKWSSRTVGLIGRRSGCVCNLCTSTVVADACPCCAYQICGQSAFDFGLQHRHRTAACITRLKVSFFGSFESFAFQIYIFFSVHKQRFLATHTCTRSNELREFTATAAAAPFRIGRVSVFGTAATAAGQRQKITHIYIVARLLWSCLDVNR